MNPIFMEDSFVAPVRRVVRARCGAPFNR